MSRNPQPPRRALAPPSSKLFGRWFVLVYLPLGLLLGLLVLLLAGLLSGIGILFFILLAAYALIAVRLLLERRRLGLEIPAPRAILRWIIVIAGSSVIGVLFLALGWHRLRISGRGSALLAVGGFLILLALVTPVFKLLDASVRGLKRATSRKRMPATDDSDA